MTSVSISPSTFFFCFSITTSSSDTFSLSWRTGWKLGHRHLSLGALLELGPGLSRPAHLQQCKLHRDLAVHTRPLLGAHRPELLFLQRENLCSGQHAQRVHCPVRGQRGRGQICRPIVPTKPLPITSHPPSGLSHQQHSSSSRDRELLKDPESPPTNHSVPWGLSWRLPKSTKEDMPISASQSLLQPDTPSV